MWDELPIQLNNALSSTVDVVPCFCRYICLLSRPCFLCHRSFHLLNETHVVSYQLSCECPDLLHLMPVNYCDMLFRTSVS